MRKFFGLLLLLTLLTRCSEYNRAVKSTDINFKFQTAHWYYAEGDYARAIPLLEELVSLTRGTQLSECVYYLHARSMFGIKDYTLASYYLANFSRTFPNSEFAEECSFLSAYCYYQNSPNYELDQTDTRSAINDLQLFLVRYPYSELKDSCNTLIDKLRAKLEVKQFDGAMQYYKLRNYQAATVALEKFQQDWPNSYHREEAMYTALKAAYHLAFNSVETRKVERLKGAIRAYRNFADAFSQSDRMEDADRLHQELNAELQRLNPTTNP